MSNELEEFEKQLNGTAVSEPAPQTHQVVQVQKNILLAYVSDAAGCGHIRCINPMTYVNSVYAKTGQLLTMVSPVFIWQHDILLKTRAIMFQRQMSPQHYEIIKKYKEMQTQYKYRMVWDMDDFVWGRNEEQGGTIDDGVPSYNFGSRGITEDIVENCIKIMKLMDVCTVSTQFLANYIKEKFGITNVMVVPNAVPAYFWGNRCKAPIKNRLTKPKVIYTGSPTHYLNPVEPRQVSQQEPNGFPGDPRKQKGDFNNAWFDWVIKSVKEDKIEFICLGGLPWFFKPIKDKIKVVDWVDSFNYHNLVSNFKADFSIMPLVKNNFNRSKSDLKSIEAYASGSIAIGSYFDDEKSWVNQGPYANIPGKITYKATVEDIDKHFDMLCDPSTYNTVLKEQYENLVKDRRYLESVQYVDTFLKPFIS